jgi:5-formyltetrahydrofolate cyclo-ligase
MIEPDLSRAALRRALRAKRRAHVESLPAAVRNICFHALPAPVLAKLPQQGCVALYMAMGAEAPTNAIALQLAARGFSLALPRLTETSVVMRFHAWQPGSALVAGPMGIEQPSADAPECDPDAFIIPLVGFDAALNRLGQGGGYYDRALALRADALRIGLAWSVQQVDAVPIAEWDVPMDMIVTEQQFFERERDE